EPELEPVAAELVLSLEEHESFESAPVVAVLDAEPAVITSAGDAAPDDAVSDTHEATPETSFGDGMSTFDAEGLAAAEAQRIEEGHRRGQEDQAARRDPHRRGPDRP